MSSSSRQKEFRVTVVTIAIVAVAAVMATLSSGTNGLMPSGPLGSSTPEELKQGYVTFFSVHTGQSFMTSSYEGQITRAVGPDGYYHLYWKEISGDSRSLRDNSDYTYSISERPLNIEDGVVIPRNSVE